MKVGTLHNTYLCDNILMGRGAQGIHFSSELFFSCLETLFPRQEGTGGLPHTLHEDHREHSSAPTPPPHQKASRQLMTVHPTHLLHREIHNWGKTQYGLLR